MTETAIDPGDILAAPYDPSRPGGAIGGLDLVVSPLLPIEPSPGEVARRIVRHGYAAARAEHGRACYFPDAAGPVGPKPGDLTRAIKIGRQLLVDRELAQAIDAKTATQRANDRHRRAEARRWRAIEGGIRAVLNAGLTGSPIGHVETFQDDIHLDDLGFRAIFTGPVSAPLTVYVHRAELEGPVLGGRDVEVVKLVAERLNRAIVERKLDEEEAGRGR